MSITTTLFVDRETRSELALKADDAKRERENKRAEERRKAREEAQAKADAIRARRRAAVQSFADQLPQRLILVPVLLATAAAWKGQFDWATESLKWGVVMGAGLATALETFGLATAAMARRARDDDDSAIIERTLMWSVVLSAALMNTLHSNQPVLGLMSVIGVAGWEVYERRRYRSRLAAATPRRLPARRPKFGPARWVRYPMWTYRAWSIALRDRLQDPNQALALADLEMTAPGGTRTDRKFLRRFRTDLRNLVAELDARTAGTGTSGTAQAVPEPTGTDGGTPDGPGTGTKSGTDTAEPTGTKRGTGTGTKRGTRTGTAQAEPTGTGGGTVTRFPRRPSAKSTRNKTASTGTTKMRAAFDLAVLENRLDELTGVELAAVADVSDSLGRRYLREWKADLATGTAQAEPATGTDN